MSKIYQRRDSPFWYAEAEVNGAVVRFSTGIPRSPKTRGAARDAAEAEVRRRQEEVRKLNTASFGGVVRSFLLDPDTRLKASTLAHYADKLLPALELWDSASIMEVTPAALRDYIKERRKLTSDIQVRHELTAISSVMEHAIDHEVDGAPEVNPVRMVRRKQLAKAASHPRVIEPRDLQALLDAAKGKFWPVFLRLLLETGMRHEEALGLTWDEVDLREGFINLGWRREKTGRGRLIPLTNTAIRTLAGVQRHPRSGYVFTNWRTGTRYVSVWKDWGRLRTKVNLSQVRLHDFRHTFASYTRRSGMDRLDRKSIMGHSSEEAHELYASSSLKSLREVLEKHSPSTVLTQEREFRGVSGEPEK